MNFLNIIRGSAITLGTFLHNGIGPIFRGLLDQIFDLAPQRRVRLEPDHIHKKERQKYYNFALGCILLALLVAKLFAVLSVFAQFQNLFPP